MVFLPRLILSTTASMADIPSIVDPVSLIGKNLKVTGTAVGTRNDVKTALQFAAMVRSLLLVTALLRY